MDLFSLFNLNMFLEWINLRIFKPRTFLLSVRPLCDPLKWFRLNSNSKIRFSVPLVLIGTVQNVWVAYQFCFYFTFILKARQSCASCVWCSGADFAHFTPAAYARRCMWPYAAAAALRGAWMEQNGGSCAGKQSFIFVFWWRRRSRCASSDRTWWASGFWAERVISGWMRSFG